MGEPIDQAGLQKRIAEALREHYLTTNRDEADADGNMPCRCGWRDPGPMGSDEDDWDGHVAAAVLPLVQAAVAEETAQLRAERDQYHAAARHLALQIRATACHWATTMPEAIPTAGVCNAMMEIASHVPDRPHLRDDLWMRIAGACEARFANDGHPEDARHAADEAMSVVQPEIDKLRADRDRLAAEVAELRARLADAEEGITAAQVAARRQGAP